MKRGSVLRTLLITCGLFSLLASPLHACTIFVLTDANRALFCNNEDWSDPKTRIWFVPAHGKHYGCVFVGFADGWSQGGLNTQGLAYDWVAGYNEKLDPDPTATPVLGNSSQQILETCSTIQEAIAYYRAHREPSFSHAKILLADRTGASVIIGAKDGKLQVESASTCRGFGYGRTTLNTALFIPPEPTAANGLKILRACAQPGQYATKYANVFDLKSGDIFLAPLAGEDEIKLNLGDELKKGGHYYDMPQIHEQLSQPIQPLLANMQSLRSVYLKPIPDREPKVTAHLRAIIKDATDASQHEADFSAEEWKRELANQKETQEVLKSFGDLISITLVGHTEESGNRTYRYLLKFKNALLLQKFVFDPQNKLAASISENVESM